ncbi:MAG: excinuclease ABC subunit UvrC [Treponema sp.]|jgi:excinuclease ABC subunit C|nr:excinuclease ABC subunit UvrC [Treponema sp.]
MEGEHQDNFAALKKTAREAPAEAGVYIMRNGEDRIIYVGKARNLRNRLSSYFSGTRDVKTSVLVKNARTIETIIVSNEYEALLLENTLIKQHSPRYNINLKDGKTYPVIRVTREDFPRVFRTRRIIEDGSLYFGPFPNIQAVDTLLELIERLFPLRKCRVLKKRESPCMYYHIGRCMAPCCGKITADEYRLQINKVKKLLSGKTKSLVADLETEMKKEAAALRFERAAGLRNAVKAIEDLSGPVNLVDFDENSRDYIAWAAEGIFTAFTVFSMRGGKMTGRELFSANSAAGESESLETFVTAYYSPDRPPPLLIYLQEKTGDDGDGGEYGELRRYFSEQFGYEPELLTPEEKHHTAIIAMARQNASEDIRRRQRERGAGPALDELREALALKSRPERIEGFDIAQLDGKHPVASLISFRDGIPDRKNYRYFKLRSVVGIVDDFAAMREAVRRRYSRLIREGKDLPDLVLIDGGIGQVNAAKGVMDELGMDSDVVGLAKREEELWLPRAKEPVILSRRSEALRVLQHVRDETHRFATSFNQRLRSGDLFFPVLQSVDGIGPRRAAAIMRVYGSVEKIAAAGVQELAERCKTGREAASKVRAAARLALENQSAAKRRLAEGVRAGRQSAAAELAAEAAEDYTADGSSGVPAKDGD